MPFPTTNWTQLAHATLNGDSHSRRNLEKMYQNYRAPVRAAVLRHWPWKADVDDLTQDFFLHLMESHMLRRARPELGRFRSYLLGALRYFLAHQLEAARAIKRGSGIKPVPLEDWMISVEDSDPDFDRQWARELFQRAFSRAESEVGSGPFAILRNFLPGSHEVPSYEDAAVAVGKPVGTLKSEVSRLRKRLKEIIRAEVALTVSAPHEIEEELRYLSKMLS